MMRRARTSSAREFVVATETGVLHRLRARTHEAVLRPAESAECRLHEDDHLEKLRDSLRDVKYEVTVPRKSRGAPGEPSTGCWLLADPLGLEEVRRALAERPSS